MTNYQIVLQSALLEGVTTPEEIEKYHAAGYPLPLFTFQRWKKYGYTVKRGEHAKLIVSLWKPRGVKKTEEAEEMPEEAEKNGYFLKKCFLFDRFQVEKTEDAEARRKAEKEAEEEARAEEYMKNRKDTGGPLDIYDELEMIRYYIMDCDLSINKTAENMGLSAATIRRYIKEAETMDRDLYFDVTRRIEARKREVTRKARAKMYEA